MQEPISSASFLLIPAVPLDLIVLSFQNSNMLTLVPDGEQPRTLLVGPKLSYMDERIAAIDLVISKLVR
jgi:hypothetical protein